MARALFIVLGGIVGLSVAFVLISSETPHAYQRQMGDLLAFVAHPIAIGISTVTGWPLQSEMGIVLHVVAIFILFAAAGMIAAGLATRRRA